MSTRTWLTDWFSAEHNAAHVDLLHRMKTFAAFGDGTARLALRLLAWRYSPLSPPSDILLDTPLVQSSYAQSDSDFFWVLALTSLVVGASDSNLQARIEAADLMVESEDLQAFNMLVRTRTKHFTSKDWYTMTSGTEFSIPAITFQRSDMLPTLYMSDFFDLRDRSLNTVGTATDWAVEPVYHGTPAWMFCHAKSVNVVTLDNTVEEALSDVLNERMFRIDPFGRHSPVNMRDAHLAVQGVILEGTHHFVMTDAIMLGDYERGYCNARLHSRHQWIADFYKRLQKRNSQIDNYLSVCSGQIVKNRGMPWSQIEDLAASYHAAGHAGIVIKDFMAPYVIDASDYQVEYRFGDRILDRSFLAELRHDKYRSDDGCHADDQSLSLVEKG